MHKLKNIDKINRTADCRICGPVRIAIASSKIDRWYCAKQKKETELKRIRTSRLKLSHSFTIKDYNHLFLKQGGVCAICKKTENKRLSIDHDHETGIVRGLLCSNCNLGIGKLFDNVEYLQSAILYLKGL